MPKMSSVKIIQWNNYLFTKFHTRPLIVFSFLNLFVRWRSGCGFNSHTNQTFFVWLSWSGSFPSGSPCPSAMAKKEWARFFSQ